MISITILYKLLQGTGSNLVFIRTLAVSAILFIQAGIGLLLIASNTQAVSTGSLVHHSALFSEENVWQQVNRGGKNLIRLDSPTINGELMAIPLLTTTAVLLADDGYFSLGQRVCSYLTHCPADLRQQRFSLFITNPNKEVLSELIRKAKGEPLDKVVEHSLKRLGITTKAGSLDLGNSINL